MNRSAYLTTGLAIKLMSQLSKADIIVHGRERIPDGPIIFVINHFTRIETLLLPYYIHNLTKVPVWSLADASLFQTGLDKFFDMVGVVSTRDPKRDELIVKSLLTGEANWIIFPEGSMIKTKKIMDGGKYMVADSHGMHEPHTGAAALALRSELYRRHILNTAADSVGDVRIMLTGLGLNGLEELETKPTTIVPVNLTYYPIRAAENGASKMAARLMKEVPERMMEELMAEGTMLLSGVDLDIRFGVPISMADYLDRKWLQKDMPEEGISGFSTSVNLKNKMRKTAHDIMQRYMHDIYAMTTVNHEHIWASFLRLYPFSRIDEDDFRRRSYYAASLIGDRAGDRESFFLHSSLQGDQGHLLTDDRYENYRNFLELAVDKGIVARRGGYLIRDRSKLSAPLRFHRGRIDNPIEVIANEVEPLKKFKSILRSLIWQPSTLLKISLSRYLLQKDLEAYREGCSVFRHGKEKICTGRPFFLPAVRRKIGVVLIHSYLAVPEEVRGLARYLRRRGMWVYAPRLPGHGTSAEDLGKRQYQEWIEAVERGYILMSTLCDRVVVGGVAVGGSLALDLAGRVTKVAGVFAVCPPFSLADYSTKFMPVLDVWKRMLLTMKRGDGEKFLDFKHGNPHVNYPKNPVAGVHEVGEYLQYIEKRYEKVTQPTLIIQADGNPVVDPTGSAKIYKRIGSVDKEYCLLHIDRHVLVNGDGSEKVYRKINDFIVTSMAYRKQLSSDEH